LPGYAKKTYRFGELNRSILEINERMLTRQLRELEGDDLINRKMYHEVPPKVEYELSERGKTLIPVLDLLADWGQQQSQSENNI